MRRSFISLGVLALFVIFASSCSENSMQPNYEVNPENVSNNLKVLAKGGGNSQSTITYSIELTDVYFDGTNTTFTYVITSNPNGGPAISHVTLVMPVDCGSDILVSSNDPLVEWSDPDPTTGVTGVKFDTGYNDEETRTVTLTLAGEFNLGLIPVAIKAGNGFVIGEVEGPVSCNITNPDNLTLNGYVFFDIDGDGIQDVDEPGIGSIEVVLSDGSVVNTDENGYYEFIVEPGDYNVSISYPDGFFGTTPSSVDVSLSNDDQNVNFGMTLDWNYPNGKIADGYTIGYWKNNIKKAIDGKTRGIQVDAATLESYLDEIADFALSPFTFTLLQEAYDVLSATGSDPVLLLKKQLIGSEFNYMNGAYIADNKLYTKYFLYYGEFIVVHSGDFSASEILTAKDWYDAYNNSHGDAIVY